MAIKWTKLFLTIFLCLSLLVVISNCDGDKAGPGATTQKEKGVTKEITTTQVPTATAPQAPTTPVIDISAFIAEFDAGIEAANTKYKGKSVELTGPYVVTILARGTNTQGPYMMLAPIGGESYEGTFVKCYTTEDEAKKYYVGQQIRAKGTVQGIASGTSGIIDIIKCAGNI